MLNIYYVYINNALFVTIWLKSDSNTLTFLLPNAIVNVVNLLKYTIVRENLTMANKDNQTNPAAKTNTASRTTNYAMNQSGQLATILMKEANHRENPQKHGSLHAKDKELLATSRTDDTGAYKRGVVKFEKARDAGKSKLGFFDKYSKAQIAGRTALVIGAAATGGVIAAFAAPVVVGGAVAGAVVEAAAAVGVGSIGISGSALAATSIAIAGGGTAALMGMGAGAARVAENMDANKTPAEKALKEQKSVEKDARGRARSASKEKSASEKLLQSSGRTGKYGAKAEVNMKTTVNNLNKAPAAEKKGFTDTYNKESAKAARGGSAVR